MRLSRYVDQAKDVIAIIAIIVFTTGNICGLYYLIEAILLLRE